MNIDKFQMSDDIKTNVNNVYTKAGNEYIVQNIGNSTYSTIQDALNASSDGDTVYVPAGTYNETLIISKQINLYGAGMNSTIINGNGRNDVITITTRCNVSGFTVINSSRNNHPDTIEVITFAAININADYVSITNCSCMDSGIGIFIHENDYLLINNNQCINNTAGIYCYGDNNQITDNIVSRNQVGVNIFGGKNSILRNQCLNNRGDGISLIEGNDNSVSSNVCLNNFYGIWVDSGDNNIISVNVCSNNTDGIVVYPGNNNEIRDNNCNSNKEVGIMVRSSSNTCIINNTCHNNKQDGIGVFFSYSTYVYDNDCDSNRIGIFIQVSYDTKVKGNRCQSNKENDYAIDPLSLNTEFSNNQGNLKDGRVYRNITLIVIGVLIIIGVVIIRLRKRGKKKAGVKQPRK